MTNLHVVKKVYFNFFPVLLTNVLPPFKHNVHVCVFTTMYMFVNCICTIYIKARVHQGLNPKTSWKLTKVLATKALQHFINNDENFKTLSRLA
jgi:hypothetical protein